MRNSFKNKYFAQKSRNSSDSDDEGIYIKLDTKEEKQKLSAVLQRLYNKDQKCRQVSLIFGKEPQPDLYYEPHNEVYIEWQNYPTRVGDVFLRTPPLGGNLSDDVDVQLRLVRHSPMIRFYFKWENKSLSFVTKISDEDLFDIIGEDRHSL